MEEVYVLMLILYFVMGTVIAYLSKKAGIKSTEDYYVAGYRLGGLLSALTYAATTYSAFMMIGLVGFAYATGAGAFGFENMYLLATIFFLGFFAPRVWKLAHERRWISPAEMLGDLYGSKSLSLIIGLIYLIALIPYATAQLVGIGNLFEGLGAGYVIGVLFGVFIIFVWTVLAGIWSVASTDVYQGLWMISASLSFIFWIVFFLLPGKGLQVIDALGVLSEKGYLGLTSFWSPVVFVSFTVPWIFFAVTNPQVVQRIYMPRDKKALETMIKYFALFGLSYTIIVVLIGLFARSLSFLGLFPVLNNRDLVTPTLLSLTNPLLGSFVFVSIIAAAVSTLNSIILTLTSSIAHDVLRLSRKDVKKSILVGRIVLVIISITTGLLALAKPGFVVELSVLSSTILLSLAVPTIYAWIFPEKTLGKGFAATLSVLYGSILSIVLSLVYGARKLFVITLLGLPVPLFIVASSTIVFFIVMLALKKP